MAARKTSLAQLQAALEANNRNDGAGRLSAGEESLLVRSDGSIRSLDDVRAIAVQSRDGYALKVGDIATVRIGQMTRYGTVTKDGQGEAVEGLVLAMRGANAQKVVDQVRARLAELEKTLPAGTTLKVFYDRGSLVERAVSTVTRALAEATILVVVLLYLFLGNVRSALVVACSKRRLKRSSSRHSVAPRTTGR